MSKQFQYYDTVTHGYTGILTLNSGVLVTNGSGVPAFSVNIPSTTTNDNATTGSMGEYIEGVQNGLGISDNTNTDVTSVSLTAGDWDVSGNVWFEAAGSTIITFVSTWVNTVSVTLPILNPYPGGFQNHYTHPIAGAAAVVETGLRRFSLASTTTIYLEAFTNFTTSTCTVHGRLRARRVR